MNQNSLSTYPEITEEMIRGYLNKIFLSLQYIASPCRRLDKIRVCRALKDATVFVVLHKNPTYDAQCEQQQENAQICAILRALVVQADVCSWYGELDSTCQVTLRQLCSAGADIVEEAVGI